MNVEIVHLFECPELVGEVARWIHEEWWSNKPGYTVSTLATRLRQARDRHSVPLSLVALRAGNPVGIVNLVESDNEERPDLTPWLAALLVAPEARGHGVGSKLVRSLVSEASRLGIGRLYLGTDIPEYYERLGAKLFEEYTGGYRIMSIDTSV